MRALALLLIGAAIVLHGGPAAADEGRIPISEATTIAMPGSYVVTSSFAGSIVIEANDVSIDFAGNTVTGNVGVGSGASGEIRLTIRNGRIAGTLSNTAPVASLVLTLSGMSLSGSLSSASCTGIAIDDSTFEGNVTLSTSTQPLIARIRDNRFYGSVSLKALADSVVRANIFGSLTVCDTTLAGHDNLIEANNVTGALTLAVCVAEGAPRNTVRGNRAASMSVASSGNTIAGNSIRHGSLAVSGASNVIDDNAIQGNGFSLVLSGNNNIFRRNILRNGNGPVQDIGSGNVDAGGNVN